MVEAASQQAVRDWGETILKKGIDLMVIATGAYGDPKLYKKHIKAAEKSGARLRLPSGAIAGLDGLLAMRLGKLERVKYVSIKPPHAWSGTPAETEFDLPSIKEPTVIFRGKPADAGRLYPKNANLAVTVALCGAGLAHTDIELVADPTLPEGTNASRLEIVGDFGRDQPAAARPFHARQSQDRRADRPHHGRRPDENGARQRLVGRSFPPPSNGGGGPQGRRGKAAVESRQISDLKFWRSPLWPSPSARFAGTSPVRRGRCDFRVTADRRGDVPRGPSCRAAGRARPSAPP